MAVTIIKSKPVPKLPDIVAKHPINAKLIGGYLAKMLTAERRRVPGLIRGVANVERARGKHDMARALRELANVCA